MTKIRTKCNVIIIMHYYRKNNITIDKLYKKPEKITVNYIITLTEKF